MLSKYSASRIARQLGFILADMKKRREAADYELGDSFIAADARHAVGMATNTLLSVETFLSEHK